MGDIRPHFSWQAKSDVSGSILGRGQTVVEFNDGGLKNGILKPGGRRIIDNDIGLRLGVVLFIFGVAVRLLRGRSSVG